MGDGKDVMDNGLPKCVVEYIDLLVKKVGYRRRVREEVRAELVGHFEDGLRDCANEKERDELGRELIVGFGDACVLGKLIRRGKKRCRALWKKVIIRGVQAVGVFMFLFGVYVWAFVNAKPVVRVDYLAQLNETVKPDVPEALNACPLLERAMENYVEMTDDDEFTGNMERQWEGLSEYEIAALNEWIEGNEQAWNDFRAASERPYYWRKYRFSENAVSSDFAENPVYVLVKDSMLSVALSDLETMGNISKLGIWRSRRSMVNGNWEEALADCLAVARMGALQLGNGELIEQLVVLAIANSASIELIQLAMNPNVPRELLEETQTKWRRLYAEEGPIIDYEGEKLAISDIIQRTFTEGGIGGGHVTIHGLAAIEWMDGDRAEQRIWVNDIEAIAFALGQSRRDEVVMFFNDWYAMLERHKTMTPYEMRVSAEVTIDEMVESLSEVRYFVLRSLLPNMGKVPVLVFRCKAEYEAALVVLALRTWEMERGDWPGSLGELVDGGYLDAVPGDPYSAGELVYRRGGDGFVLYSLGADFDDDGGVQAEGDKWGRDGGDRVFWPMR